MSSMSQLPFAQVNRLDWMIENFVFCNHQYGPSLASPIFSFNIAQKTRWMLQLRPDVLNANTIHCHLIRFKDEGRLGRFLFDFTLCIVTASGKAHFQREIRESGLEIENQLIIYNFLDRRKLDDTDLHGNALNVVFEMKILKTMNKTSEKDCERLSGDMKNVLQSGLHSDVTLIVDDKQFKVHKFMLCARCPGLFPGINLQKNSRQTIEVPYSRSLVEQILHYMYTGKMLSEEVKFELHSAALKCHFDELLDRKETLTTEVRALSKIYFSNVFLEWSLSDLSIGQDQFAPFTQKINLDEVYTDMLVKFDEENLWKNRKLKVEFSIPGFVKEIPIFVKIKFSLVADEYEILYSQKAEHLFLCDQPWLFPPFIWMSDIFSNTKILPMRKNVKFTCDISASDSRYESLLKGTCAEVSRELNKLDNLQKLSVDISKLLLAPKHADIFLICDGQIFRAHSALLANTSGRFKDMIQQEFNKLESKHICLIISDLQPVIFDILLQFIYGKSISEETMLTFSHKIYDASILYDIPSLANKCTHFLNNNIKTEILNEYSKALEKIRNLYL